MIDRTRPCLRALVLATALVLAGGGAPGQAPIDFETIPGDVPSDGLPISTQFLATHGVSFSLESGGTPVLAQVGPAQTAFQGYLALPDEPAPGTNAGQFFLNDDGIVSNVPSALIITYAVPVGAASGVILDIDGQEEWLVEARDLGGVVVASVTLGPNNTLDGSATTWSFNPALPVIAEIRMTFTGLPGGVSVGFAFDNFNAQSVGPGTGQANGADASLVINGVGTGTGNGPFPVVLGPASTMTLDWEGPAFAPLMLVAGPRNPANATIPCVGSVDIGTPPAYADLLVLFDGTVLPMSLFFRLDAAGTASQSFALPSVPPGPFLSVQGLVLQPPGSSCNFKLTAAFAISIL